jgi:elongation factor 1-alpha
MRPTETNIAICGHAKHGKSTLAGRLMFELGAVSGDDLLKYQREANTRGKDFNQFNMIFLERRPATFKKDGQPDDPSRSVFPERGSVRLSEENLLTLIDTPGFSRFIDNIIYGIYLADLAVLVVEAPTGVIPVTKDLITEFHSASSRHQLKAVKDKLAAAGIESGAIAASNILDSFAIPAIAVFVTKMDLIGYSESQFNEIKEQIQHIILPLLARHSEPSLPIVPVSALTGVGFKESQETDEQMVWYKGPTALDVIRGAKDKKPPAGVGSVRFAVEGSKEIYRTGAGTVLVGSLETGVLKTNDKLIIEPASSIEKEQIIFRVGTMQKPRPVNVEGKIESEDSISARAIVAMSARGIDKNYKETHFNKFLRHGGVIGTLNNPPAVATEIMADVIFFEPNKVYSGKEYTVLANASRSTGRIVAIEKGTGIFYDLNDEQYDAGASERVRARLRFERPICIEAEEKYQRLTRFLLREHDRVVACGRCCEILNPGNLIMVA